MKNRRAPLINVPAVLLALTMLLTACSTGGQEPPQSQEQGPAVEQEIDPGKEVLICAQVVGPGYIDSLRRDAIDKFNRTHDNVQIVVKDYSYTPEDGHGIDRLLVEIAAGQVPDIIDMGGSLPFRQLARKGYLEDLWPYIENDPELGRAGVLEAPLKAAEVDGGLYMLFGAVRIATLVGSADQVGDRTSWTLRELQDAFAAMPEGSTLLSFDTSRERIAPMVMRLAMESFVDWETGDCSFDSPNFRSMLDFISLFPSLEEVEKETADIGDFMAVYNEAASRRKKGLQMLEECDVTFGALPVLDAWWGGRCAFIGYPTEDGSVGSIFRPYGQRLAISSSCGNKEAAWEFVRTVLTYSPDGSHIPIKRERYESAKTAAMYTKPIIEVSPAGDITAPSLTEEQAQRFEDFFNSIDKIDIWDNTLYSLITEICGPYFAGDKTLDETVRQIQNRVSLYVNESR